MAASQVSTKSPTIRRILREASEISNSTSPDYSTEPLESDLFEWHFTLRGPPNSVYSQGIYHGRIILPPTYPLRPPSFRFTTPNGRFEPNREICLSISGHHEETWQPAWGIRTALVALRSFMETDARGQLGGIDTTDAVRRRLAQESGPFRCSTCARSNNEIISEAEKRARESLSMAKDVQVPKELKMGWTKEIRPGKIDEISYNTQLDIDHDLKSQPKAVDTPGGAGNAEGSARNPLEPFAKERLSTPLSPLLNPTVERIPRNPPAVSLGHYNVVPLWVDRVIIVLVVLLIALLLKTLYSV